MLIESTVWTEEQCTMLPLFTKHHNFALLQSNGKDFTLNDSFLKPDLLWSFEPKKTYCKEKFTYGLAVAFKVCYFIMLRGRKEGQECASIGHLEIFSISSGERPRKSRGP